MSLIIECQTIPYKKMRYNSLGDYCGHERLRFFQIADMNNAKYEALVFLHEFIEFSLCLERGISEESITKFDIEFEKNRKSGDDSEPGDDPTSPYYKEHQEATEAEKWMCEKLGLDWNAYCRYLNEYISREMKG